MRDAEGKLVFGKTRWRRFGLSFGLSMSIVVTVLALMATGAIALPVTISGTTFTVTADSLSVPPASVGPNAFQQYGNVDPTGGAPVGVATTVLTAGTLVNLHQTVCGPTGLGGPFANLKIVLTASTAKATGGLVVDATDLTGNATFTNIQIGVPITNPRTGLTTFGQTADGVSITSLNQTAVYTQAGTFELSGLGLHASLVGSC